jgi:hypothetical protein
MICLLSQDSNGCNGHTKIFVVIDVVDFDFDFLDSDLNSCCFLVSGFWVK